MNYGIQNQGCPTQESVFMLMDYAFDNGIEMFDTASVYGEAEKLLGEYFHQNPHRLTNANIVTKLRADAFENVDKKKWSEIAIDNALKSISQMGIKRLKAYLFHNASYIFDECAVDAIASVKNDGLAEKVGVSVYSPEEALKALEYSEIEVIQIPYNVFDHRLDKVCFFEKAKEKGVVIFARSTLLQGLVMMDANHLPSRVSFARDTLIKYHDICNKNGLNPLETAIGYVGNKEGVDYIVFGTDNIFQLKEYISMRDAKISEEIKKDIETTFFDVEERIVNPVLWR